MNHNPEPRSRWWVIFAIGMLLLSFVLFMESRQAQREGRMIRETHKHGPMTPAQGYLASALSGSLGIWTLAHWIRLRRRKGDRTRGDGEAGN